MLRVRIPIELHEKVRLESARRAGKEYRPLNPPPPSGFVDLSLECKEPAYTVLNKFIEARRARGETVSVSDVVIEAIKAGKLSSPGR